MTFDLTQARRDTPGCEKILHFNNAGSSLPTAQVLETVLGYLRRESEVGGYECAEEHSHQLAEVPRSIARLLNCSPSEVALVESATSAWAKAASSISFQPGERVLISHSEYISNYLMLLQLAKLRHFEIEIIPDDPLGQISLEDLERSLKHPGKKRVRLVALTHVPSTSGLINPAVEVGKLARAAGALFLLDACQSVGQLELDVREIGCDFLGATGRKFLRAPRGSGFLYVKREIQSECEPLFLDFSSAVPDFKGSYEMADSAQRFENFEMSYASRLGLGAAVDYALGKGMPSIEKRIQSLAEHLRTSLNDIPGVQIQDPGLKKSGIVTFTIQGQEPASVQKRLRENRIHVSYSSEASLDLKVRKIPGVVRASVHYYNTEEEIAELVRSLRALSP